MPSDLPVRYIPMHIDVIGSPLSFQMSKEQPPVVRFGMHVCGGNEISRNMKINNSSHKEIRLDWHTFVLDGDDQQLIDLDVYIGEPFPPCINHGDDDDKHVLDKMSDMKLFTVVLNEHQGKRCSIPFDIPNKQMVVCGKGSANIQVVFKPVYEGVKEKHFLGYALGYMSLQNQDREGDDGTFIRADGLNMFPFALNMTGSVKPAKVYLEACNESGFNFELSATNLLKAAKQINVADCQRDDGLCYCNRYVLVNKTDVLIQFKCLVEKPFTVYVHHDKQVNNKKKTKKDNSLISLKSRKNLEFHIKFDLDASLLENIVDNIEEEFIIKKPFIIEFTNKSRQEYELTAIINFPIMQLSTSEVDFGVCHVGEMRELSLCIHNPSKADLFWRAEIDKNCPKACIDAFAIQSTSGKISNAWSSQHRDSYVDVKIQFTAAHNVEYEAIMEITSLFHEQFLKISPMKVFLRGIGSYDEATKVK